MFVLMLWWRAVLGCLVCLKATPVCGSEHPPSSGNTAGHELAQLHQDRWDAGAGLVSTVRKSETCSAADSAAVDGA